MCLIIDANRCSQFAPGNNAPEAIAILDWIEKKRGRIVVGGLLTEELAKSREMGRLLREIERIGCLVRVPDAPLEAARKMVVASGLLQSDDPHIVALAINSCADVVYTEDKALMADLKNKKVCGPRPSIYRTIKHKALLGKGCPQPQA